MMLQQFPEIDPSAPMSLGALWAIAGAIIAIVGVAITWWTFALRLREFKAKMAKDEAEREQREDEHMQVVIKRVCKEFTGSDDYLLRLDRQMISTAVNVTEEAFRTRAASFVDAGEDRVRREEMEKRVNKIEQTVLTLREDLRDDLRETVAEIGESFKKSTRELLLEVQSK